MKLYKKNLQGSFSLVKEVTVLDLERSANEVMAEVRKIHRAGYTAWLNCKRSPKQHNLGDQWAVDRQRGTAQGNKVQQIWDDTEDFELLVRAISRGCQ